MRFYPLWTDTRTGIQELFTDIVKVPSLMIQQELARWIDLLNETMIEHGYHRGDPGPEVSVLSEEELAKIRNGALRIAQLTRRTTTFLPNERLFKLLARRVIAWFRR